MFHLEKYYDSETEDKISHHHLHKWVVEMIIYKNGARTVQEYKELWFLPIQTLMLHLVVENYHVKEPNMPSKLENSDA